jgi:speckle-type POZ protein
MLLHNKNKKDIEVNCNFAIKDSNGAIVLEKCFSNNLVQSPNGNGFTHFFKRSTFFEANSRILKDGALRIDVTIQVKKGKDPLYQPPSALSERQLKLLKSGERADISFNVGGKVFTAHLAIIYANAPILADHCNKTKQKKKSEEIIKDMKPDVFQILLKHIYSGCLPSEQDALQHGKELIDAANKYELIELKMAVENALVRERVMTKKNVADYILFADAQSCALLKEYAISYLLLHSKHILKSEHSKCLRESGEVLSEIVMLMSENDDDEEAMSVLELRKELGKCELDVDGSKETLVLRLKEAKRQKTD